MSNFNLINLDRKAYIASMETIQDSQTVRFAQQSLEWWDRHFSWNAKGCAVLCDENNTHLSYLFSYIDGYGQYLTLYNLFTPLEERRKGYAHILLRLTIAQAVEKHTRRITFSSISSSLNFYLSQGFVYWGINKIGDFYCNLPLPANGLDGIAQMVQTSDIQTLLGSSFDKIYAKVNSNETKLTPAQMPVHESDVLKLGTSYRRDQLQIHKIRSTEDK